jgi:WD40 repeat protein
MTRSILPLRCVFALLSLTILAGAARAEELEALPPGAVARLGTDALRHSHTVSALGFSGDGKRLISASWDKTARVWDVASGREICRFAGHKDGASAAAISPDGTLAASGDMNRTTVLWDARTGKEIHRVPDNPNTVFWLRFSADGKRLVWSSGKAVRIWDVTHWHEERQIKIEEGVRPVVLSPDGATLAVGCEKNGGIRIFNINDGSLVKTLEGHSKNIFSLAFNSDGSRLVSGAADKTVRIWDVSSGAQLQSVEVPDHWVQPVVFMNDGKSFATGTQDGTVRFFETASGKKIATLQAFVRPDVWVMTMAVSPDGKILTTAGTERAIRLWDAKTLAPIGPAGHGAELTSAAFLDGGKTVATASQDGLVGVWNAENGQWIGHLGEGAKIGAHVAASANGKRVAVATENPSLEIFDGARRNREMNISDRLIAMHGLAMSAKSGLIAVAFRHDTIRVIDGLTGTERFSVKIDPRQFAEVPLAFSCDGKLLAIGSGDPDVKMVTLLETGAGRHVGRIETASGGDYSLAFSPDDMTLAVACRGKPIQLFEVASGGFRASIEGDGDAGTCVAFSPDGRWIAAGGGPDQPTVRVWSLPSGKLVKKFVGHKGWLKQVVFSPDSKRLLSASEDTTALLWDVTNIVPPAQAAADEAALAVAWADLDNANPARAYSALQRLVAAGDSGAAYAASHLPAPMQADERQMKQLIADLAADAYATRQAAQRRLQDLGEAARAALHQATEQSNSEEIRNRAAVLLKHLEHPENISAENLRIMRAIEVLERTRSVKLLEEIASKRAGTLAGLRAGGVLQRLRAAE